MTAIVDESLSGTQYVELGVPAFDRAWTGSEMKRAFTVLAKLESKEKLPRHQSIKSGAVFARFIDPKNIELIQQGRLAIGLRMQALIEQTDAFNAIMKLYHQAARDGSVSARELHILMAHQLAYSKCMAEMAEEFIPTISADDPKREVRMRGVARMDEGNSGLLSNVLAIVEEGVVAAADREHFVLEIKAAAPLIYSRSTPLQQQEFRAAMVRIAKMPSMKEFAQEFLEIESELVARQR